MTDEDRLAEIESFLVRELATVLATDEESITPQTPLASLGVDSIRFVEILIAVEKEYGVRLIEAGLTREDLRDVASLARRILAARAE